MKTTFKFHIIHSILNNLGTKSNPFIFGLFTLILFANLASAQTGLPDPSFVIGSGFNNSVNALVVQTDQKIIVGGFYTAYNGTTVNRMVRLENNGSIDNSFAIGTGFNNPVTCVAIQPDNKILVGGVFTNYNGTARNRIIRLNSDGTVDAGFNIGTGFNDYVRSIVIQPDGKILVAGNFYSYNGTSSQGVIRLNSDGTVDSGFSVGINFNNSIYSISLQSDGNIICGGIFTEYNGTSRNYIARITSTGALDPTFNPGTGFNFEVKTTSIDNNGKILVGGNFTTYNGSSISYYTRLNSDGTVDPTFVSGTGFNNAIYNILVQSDNKVLLGGAFTSYNGVTHNRIIRLNDNGQVDALFNTGTGLDGFIYTSARQLNGKILIGGEFTTVNSISKNKISRLKFCIPDSTLQSVTVCDSYTWSNGTTYLNSGNYTQVLTNVSGCDSVITLNLTVNHQASSTFSDLSCGPYYWELTGQTYSFPGSYSHTLQTIHGCDSVVTLSLQVSLPPVTQINYDGVTISVTGAEFSNFLWINCLEDEIIPGEGNETFTPISNGSYTALVEYGNWCYDTLDCIVVSNLGTTDLTEIALNIYPNPSNELITVSFEGTNATYTIYDAQGKRIQTSTIQSGGTVSLRDLQTGVYLFEFTTENGKTVKRVVKD